ncbi:hypothetical protein HYW94_00150 [Candidatus Uhrbacteria bacterium]|nr:hypothetical protein [Candidatus Uhrbacteria bacterium]
MDDTSEMSAIIHSLDADPLTMLKECGGYYECPKGEDGKRLGPLVGYAGTYEMPDSTRKQWVGDAYANFAKAEEFPRILATLAYRLEDALRPFLGSDAIFCGAPIGGYCLSQALGFTYDRRVIKAEKKVTALATASTREKSELIFARHEITSGENVIIVEDVCNNFSTTTQLVSLVEKSGGTVTAIVCLLNRSLDMGIAYRSQNGIEIPIISLVRLIIPEYRQDDPEVAEDIAHGNVIWKPKNEWPRLMKAMERDTFRP